MDETQSSARWVSHARGADESLRLFLEAEGGRLVAAGGITFGRATDDYIASLEARIRAGSFRPSTLRTYSNIIEADLRPRWGDRPVGTISREDVEAYRAELVKRSLAASTINQTRAIVRGIFAVAKLDADPSVRRRPIGYLHAREHTEGDVGGHQLLHPGRDAAASRKRRRRAGRGPLPDRSLHGAEGERATGTALAVDRLHGLAGPRRQGLHGRGRRGSPKELSGAVGAAHAAGRPGADAATRARALHR